MKLMVWKQIVATKDQHFQSNLFFSQMCLWSFVQFWKLMEKFQFYLNPVHFFILFFDFKVRLKWGKSKIQKYFSEKKSVFFADLPHNRPFPGLWCKKKFQIDFSQKNDFDLNPVFNPVQPQVLYKKKLCGTCMSGGSKVS